MRTSCRHFLCACASVFLKKIQGIWKRLEGSRWRANVYLHIPCKLIVHSVKPQFCYLSVPPRRMHAAEITDPRIHASATNASENPLRNMVNPITSAPLNTNIAATNQFACLFCSCSISSQSFFTNTNELVPPAISSLSLPAALGKLYQYSALEAKKIAQKMMKISIRKFRRPYLYIIYAVFFLWWLSTKKMRSHAP